MIDLSDHELRINTTIDLSSVYGIFNFGVLPLEDERLKRAVARTEAALRLKIQTGGLARYEGDKYYRLAADYPGNPWFITTLRLMQYQISAAKSEADLQPARDCFEWVTRYAKPSGILSEQLNPFTGEQLSVAPLTWSHAEFVITVINYLDKLEALGVCPASNPVNA
jgi:GH15 family glucan-1,4-alpha-glucosidase